MTFYPLLGIPTPKNGRGEKSGRVFCMNMLLHWEYLIAGRPRDHKGWDGNGGIPAQHTPVNRSREIGRGVG